MVSTQQLELIYLGFQYVLWIKKQALRKGLCRVFWTGLHISLPSIGPCVAHAQGGCAVLKTQIQLHAYRLSYYSKKKLKQQERSMQYLIFQVNSEATLHWLWGMSYIFQVFKLQTCSGLEEKWLAYPVLPPTIV